MDIGASGIIFGVVVILWVAYVLPLLLLRYDEAQRKLPIGGSFSRVIKRTEPKADPEAEAMTQSAPAPTAPRRASDQDRPAARRAARRRRLVLYFVGYVALMIAAAAAMHFVPVWTIGIGVALVIGWLVTCRYQVTIERGLTREKPATAARPARPQRPAKAAKPQQDADKAALAKLLADYENTVVISGQVEDHDPDVPHVMETAELETNALEEKLQIAVPSASSSGTVLWDPLPVTLPTYVTKPRAGRTVRTIDFEQPGSWTSGHIEGEQTEFPVAAAEQDDAHPEAVGT